MTHIWKYIDAKEWTERGKFRFTLWLFGFIFAITGFVIWLIIRNWCLSTIDWMFCFVGYPIFTSIITVFFYSCRHEYHNGSYK